MTGRATTAVPGAFATTAPAGGFDAMAGGAAIMLGAGRCCGTIFLGSGFAGATGADATVGAGAAGLAATGLATTGGAALLAGI